MALPGSGRRRAAALLGAVVAGHLDHAEVRLGEGHQLDPAARTAYEGLAYSHRKEYAVWVGEAKRPETRARRAAQALSMLAEGRTRS